MNLHRSQDKPVKYRAGRILVSLGVLGFVLFGACGVSKAQEQKRVTILHTNDMHSHFLASPNADYSPGSTGDDATIGGVARIAAKVREVRDARGLEGTPVLLLDGGDFTMGTLFHLLRGEAEMGIMNFLGYDAVTLGNHEFDLLPTATAEIVSHRGNIRVVATNLQVLDLGHPWGAAIQALMDSGDILPWTTQTVSCNGADLKVGYFGIMGESAWEDVNKPYGEALFPLGMADRFQAAAAAVDYLRNTEGADIVICLSHSGVNEPAYWTGEDVDLANQVPGIDVIVSGHTHTLIPTPVVVGKTTIVQAKSYTSRLGVLDLEYNEVAQKWDVLGYQSAVIDDSIQGDPDAIAEVQTYIDKINDGILAPLGHALFSDPAVETIFDLKGTYAVEHSLGNLVTDAIRWSVDRALGNPDDPVVAAVESDGVIRSNILAGTTAIVQTSDAFEVVPLGVDPVSGKTGYPLVSFCMYGSELYQAAWVDSLAAFLQDSDFWISWSGVGFAYTDYLPPFVLWRCLNFDDPSCHARLRIGNDNSTLYRVAVNYYVASNIERLEDVSYGLLNVVPKDCATGHPLSSLDQAIVYKAPGDPLLQWEGFLDYLASFPDRDSDGVPDMQSRYSGPEGRIVRACIVASVAHGSPLNEKVGVLRSFRDRILLQHDWGRRFVDAYYSCGPEAADWLERHAWAKSFVRLLLLPLIGMAKVALFLSA